jgi:hypothetical protein
MDKRSQVARRWLWPADKLWPRAQRLPRKSEKECCCRYACVYVLFRMTGTKKKNNHMHVCTSCGKLWPHFSRDFTAWAHETGWRAILN